MQQASENKRLPISSLSPFIGNEISDPLVHTFPVICLKRGTQAGWEPHVCDVMNHEALLFLPEYMYEQFIFLESEPNRMTHVVCIIISLSLLA
jgi:hypothetical protein